MRTQTRVALASLSILACWSPDVCAQACLYPEEQHPLPATPDSAAQFGSSVDVEGDIAVVGAKYEDTEAGAAVGAAYVFERTAGQWIQKARLVAPDGHASAFFGSAISISGNRIAVGSTLADPNGLSDAGAIYVFEAESGTWVSKAKLIAADATAGMMLGFTLDLDGNQLVGGAAGSCYVFEHLLGNWFQTAKLSIGNFPELDIDPNRLIASSLTSARIFEKQGATWIQTASLQGVGPATNQAARVGLSGDRAVVSTQDWRVFVRQSGGWVLEHSLDNAGDFAPVAMHGDRIALGFLVGHVQIWQRSSSGWSVALTAAVTDDVSMGEFASAIAIHDTTALVGAPTVGPTDDGTAYVIDSTPPFHHYGSSCPGTGGYAPMLTLGGCAKSGGSIDLSLQSGLGGSVGAILIGLDIGSTPLGSGCSLLISGVLPQAFMLPLFGTGPGGGSVAIAIGLPPNLQQGSIAIQAFAADPVIPKGFTSTNGVLLTTR